MIRHETIHSYEPAQQAYLLLRAQAESLLEYHYWDSLMAEDQGQAPAYFKHTGNELVAMLLSMTDAQKAAFVDAFKNLPISRYRKSLSPYEVEMQACRVLMAEGFALAKQDRTALEEREAREREARWAKLAREREEREARWAKAREREARIREQQAKQAEQARKQAEQARKQAEQARKQEREQAKQARKEKREAKKALIEREELLDELLPLLSPDQRLLVLGGLIGIEDAKKLLLGQ